MLFDKNDKAVSPVVATLVLIVVAIIGAAAVGALLGAFSGNVGQQANAQGTSAASSNTLSVVGSTTMQPASQFLASDYEKAHQGVQINVQGGGSGAGVTAAGQGVADIGSASRAVKTTELNTYPDLKTFEIGACGACFITGTSIAAGTIADQTTELAPSFSTGVGVLNLSAVTAGHVYTRQDSSGTKDTVTSWLQAAVPTFSISGTCVGKSGSQAVEDAVDGDPIGLGYVDYGFTIGDPNVHVLSLKEEDDVFGRKTVGNGGVITPIASITLPAGGVYTPGANGANILAELKHDQTGTGYGSNYPEGLLQPLFYITNGAPNTLEQNFIDFARSPNGDLDLKKANYFGITEYK